MGLAEQVHSQANRHAMRARNVLRAEVVKAKPLKVELFSSRQVLDDDDFDLTAWMQLYSESVGIKIGDTVLVQREAGEYFIFDIVGDDGSGSLTGAKGDKGDKGNTGSAGEKGDQGDQGVKGDTGDTGDKGDKGDRGDPGDSGVGGDGTYLHMQGSPSALWSVTHNLGKYPSVTVIDSALQELEAQVDFIDLDHLSITFSGATSGSATLN